MKRSLLLLCGLTALMIMPDLMARTKPAPTAPGTYKEWGPDIDELEVVKTFRTSDYARLVVVPFDTSKTAMPDKSEKSFDTISAVLVTYAQTLVEALKPELKTPLDVTTQAKAPSSPKTLILRGSVLDLSPGSRAKRYLAGYGAGAAGTKLNGELVDAATGKVLLRFTQERRSGGTFKFGGGNDMDVMRDSIHAAGKDVAHILDSF